MLPITEQARLAARITANITLAAATNRILPPGPIANANLARTYTAALSRCLRVYSHYEVADNPEYEEDENHE